MKFGGFTERSRIRAMMRSLQEQKVVINGELNGLQNEPIIHFAGPEHRRISKASMIDLYLRYISKQEIVYNAKMLLGIRSYRYKLDPDRFSILCTETKKNIRGDKKYSKLRWHDVIVLLLIEQIAYKNTELYDYAYNHLAEIEHLFLPDMTKWYNHLLEKNWS